MKLPLLLWDGCELHLGTGLLEPTPLAIPAQAMKLRRQRRSQMEFRNGCKYRFMGRLGYYSRVGMNVSCLW